VLFIYELTLWEYHKIDGYLGGALGQLKLFILILIF